MKYNIVIATHGLPFNGNTDREKALGGSETAVINVARELAKQGHYVRVFNNCDKPGLYDGVVYLSNQDWKHFVSHSECDILIVSRHHEMAGTYKINSKLNILWNHDILTRGNDLMASAWNYDYMYCLSEFHRKQYREELPDLEKYDIKLQTNGIDLNIVPKRTEKKHRIMFTSRPERGLYNALQLYEKYGDLDLELLICNYQTLNDPNVAQLEQLCNFKIQQLKDKGFKIEFGRFPKKELYEKISESMAVLYPTNFPEIFCISALEAQACGTAFIATDDYALPEIMAKGYPLHKHGKWMDGLFKVLRDDVHRGELEKLGIENAKNYTWASVAKRFIDDAESHFKERSKDTLGIIQKMLYESDLVLARDALIMQKGEVEGGYDLLKEVEHKLRFVDGKEPIKQIYENEDTHANESYEELIKIPRMRWLSDMCKENGIKRVLSVGCHTGAAERYAAEQNKGLEVVGIDISENAIKKAIENLARNDLKVAFAQADIDDINVKGMAPFDALFLGEILEHVKNPHEFIGKSEALLKEGGKVFITLPRGAWEHLSHEENNRMDITYHAHSFDWWDIQNMFSQKKDFDLMEYWDGHSRGYCDEFIGNWLLSYTKEGAPRIGPRDLERKLLLTRPYQSITACIIAKDCEKDIEKLVDSIHFEMDEIIIRLDHKLGDGSSTETIARLAKYPKVTPFFAYENELIVKDNFGFGPARNQTISEAKSKWIFWIDTDEVLLKKDQFRKYLDTPFLDAYTIYQQHPQIDSFLVADKPQRLFRKGKGEFVGYIHEQVMDINDINKSIQPSLIIADCHVLNFGELHEGVRREKALNRNYGLLEKDTMENVDKRRKEGKPIRLMTIILIMRDFANRISYSLEKHKSPQSRDIHELSLPKIKELYANHFSKLDSSDINRQTAYKIMQRAMELGQDGTEVEFKIGKQELKKRLEKQSYDELTDFLKDV